MTTPPVVTRWEDVPKKGDVIWERDGLREWRRNRKTHREDGPAVEHADGSPPEFWLNGVYYRTEAEHREAVEALHARDTIATLQARIDAALALHRVIRPRDEGQFVPYCGECEKDWPCRTDRALGVEEASE